jgi:hypothetical protein
MAQFWYGWFSCQRWPMITRRKAFSRQVCEEFQSLIEPMVSMSCLWGLETRENDKAITFVQPSTTL